MTPPSVSGRSTTGRSSCPSRNMGGLIRLCRSSGLVRGGGLRLGLGSGLGECACLGLGSGLGECACLVLGSGLGVRAVRARSRAARARARGEEGSRGLPVSGWRKVEWGEEEGERTGMGGGQLAQVIYRVGLGQ